VDTAGSQLGFSPPELLFRAGSIAAGLTDTNHVAVSADGSRFYVPMTVAQPDSGVIHIRMGNAK
jgi:hypothetical protein